MSETLVFVRWADDGGWVVASDDGPVSSHPREDEAERAAIRYARGHGGGLVVLHDRYCRCHVDALPADATGAERPDR